MFNLIPFSNDREFFDPFFDFGNRLFSDYEQNMIKCRVDITEDEQGYKIAAEIPGFSKEEIGIDLGGNRLTIKAEHNEENNLEEKKYIHRERKYSSFLRSFDITGIDVEKITAKYENGLLELSLPKLEIQKPSAKRIEIN